MFSTAIGIDGDLEVDDGELVAGKKSVSTRKRWTSDEIENLRRIYDNNPRVTWTSLAEMLRTNRTADPVAMAWR